MLGRTMKGQDIGLDVRPAPNQWGDMVMLNTFKSCFLGLRRIVQGLN